MKFPGLLKRGSKGPAVMELQKRLGIKADGDFGPKTERAVKMFQAVARDAQGNALLVDGQVGSITWAALGLDDKPEPKPANKLGAMVLEVAESQIGVTEQKGNRGPQVARYLKSVGLGEGYPWCMAFVYWVFDQAADKMGIDNPACCSASCSAVYRWAKQRGKLVDEPAPGDVMLVKGGRTGHMHTGIVTGVSGGYVTTIEGNSNTSGSAEGTQVVRHRRKINSLDFVRFA